MRGSNQKDYKMDLCTGSILRKMILFALPIMLSSILQLLFNAADIVVVAQFSGDNAMSAVGSNGSLINLITNAFIGLSIGANVLASRYFGAKKDRDLSETVHTSILVSFIGGIALMVFGIIFADDLLKLMGLPAAILPLSTLYMRIYFIGMPASMLYNFGSALLRAVGDTRRPLYYLFFAGVINVLLNLLLVIVFHMGVAGVAIATIVSQMISAYLVILCLCKEKGAIQLRLKELRVYKNKLLQIIKIGLPAGVQGTIFSFSNTVIQSTVNSFNEVVIAGNTAAVSIEGFTYVAMNCFYQATLSFTSQNYGARLKKRIIKAFIVGVTLVTIVGLGIGYVVCLFGPDLLRIYSKDAAIIEAGMVRLRIIQQIYFLCGIMDVLVGLLRGLGYSIMPMIVSLLGACAFRLIWIATVFRMEEYHNISTVYYSYPISWILTIIVHIICFFIVRKRAFKRMEIEL